MSDSMTSDENDYAVGWGKPPKDKQFKPGESGNPSGSSNVVRARKAKKGTFMNLLGDGMQRPVEVEEHGKRVIITRMHLAIRRRVEEAAKGNIAALKEIFKLRDAKDMGPVVPGKRFILTLDEARAVGPLGYGLYRPDVVIIRDPKPTAVGNQPKRKAAPPNADIPYRSVRQLIEIEFDRVVPVTDPASGATKRMTMREVIAEQLIRQFAAGKPGTSDLMIKLTTQTEIDPAEFRTLYVGVPWDFEMPPRCDMYGRPLPNDGGQAGTVSG